MKKVPDTVINRLPRYYRHLTDLSERGIERTSSSLLSKKLNMKATQIRQDLSTFGVFGIKGYGYDVVPLLNEISKILGLERGYTAVLFGAGNMGKAFVHHINFEKRGFRLTAIFDVDPNIIGSEINGLTVRDYSEAESFIRTHKTDVAILAVSRSSVQSVANKLIGCGIKGFLNFTYTELLSHDGINVENVHLGDNLMKLSYKLTAEKTN